VPHHWLGKVRLILEADTADLRELALLAGANPKTFYVGARLKGVDVRGQDLRGMKFSEDQIGELAFDQATIMDLPLLATLRRAGQGEIKDRKQDAFYDLWERGLELYSHRRYEEAAAFLRETLKRDSNEEAVWLKLGKALEKAGPS
jgi:tetratricopeptide (TPR) repeat protein